MMRSRRLSLPALWLLAAALFCAKALMPVGWMPVADAGGIRIELCTGQGAISATLDAQGRLHKDGDRQDQNRDKCPFGLIVLAAGLPAAPVLAIPFAPTGLVASSLPLLIIAARPQGLGPPGQAPPLTI